MTKQEAYAKLAADIKTVNGLIADLNKFARDNGLVMGQMRYNPMVLDVKPVEGVERTPTDDDDDWTSSDYEDRWLSSQC